MCRYDGHFWQQDTPFPVTISEVGKELMISLPNDFIPSVSDSPVLYVASPFPCPQTAIDVLSPRMITCHSICSNRYQQRERSLTCRDTLQFSPPIPPFFQSGYYDWCILCPEDRHVASKGRTIVFPSSTSSHQFYEVGDN